MALLTPAPSGDPRRHRPVRYFGVLAVVALVAAALGVAWWLGDRAGDDVVSSSAPSTSTTAARAPTTTSRPTTTTAPPQSLLTLRGHTDDVQDAAFSPDGTKIVTSGGFDGTVRIWDAVTGAPLATFPAYSMSTAFSTDGARIVTSSMDGTATVWDVARGELLSTLPGNPEYLGAATAAFRPGGTEVVTARGDDSAWVWDGTSGRLLRELTAGPGRVQMAAFSPDGTKILTNRLTVDTVEVWGWPSGRHLATLGGGQYVTCATFSPDGTKVISCAGTDATVWDVATGQPVLTLHNPHPTPNLRIFDAEFSPDGTRIVTGDQGDWGVPGSVAVWDAADGTLLTTLREPSLRWSASGATFSPDGTKLLVTRVRADSDLPSRPWLELWDVTSATQLRTFEGHAEQIVSARFAPDGTRFVTASYDDTAMVWAVDGRPAPP